MTLVNELVWQLDINQSITGGTITETGGSLILAIKNSLIGFASSPWIVAGSSNKVSFGMDGVDRWVTNADTTWISPSGSAIHPWIVLEQPGMGGLQLLISGPKTDAQYPRMYWAVSPSGSFTGGNVTGGDPAGNPPSAPDEVDIVTVTNFITSVTSLKDILHVMQSEDGYCTRICVYTTSLAAVSSITMLETIKNTAPAFTYPYAFYSSGLAGPGLSTTINQLPSSIFNGTKYQVGFTWEGTEDSIPIHRGPYGVINRIISSYHANPIGIASVEVGMRGKHGQLYDVWWGPGVLVSGTNTYFSTKTHQSKNYVQFDELIFPWDGSSDVTIT